MTHVSRAAISLLESARAEFGGNSVLVAKSNRRASRGYIHGVQERARRLRAPAFGDPPVLENLHAAARHAKPDPRVFSAKCAGTKI